MQYYPEETYTVLEFDKIRLLLSDYCESNFAKNKAVKLKPVTDFNQLTLWLNQTNELKQTLQSNAYFPDLKFKDCEREIKLLNIEGSVLDAFQLNLIKETVTISNTIIKFLHRQKEIFPNLFFLVKLLQPNEESVQSIEKIIDEKNEVRDSASKELSDIRQKLASKRRESAKRFSQYVQQLNQLGYLRDTEESFINDRRVLAVISEHKRDVSGIMHTTSDTGKTTFIEPIVTLELNNQISELLDDERREIHRLLRSLCNYLRPFSNQFASFFQCLGWIDFIKAKAKFALNIHANLPVLESTPIIKYIAAVHPLLYLQNKKVGKKTVPFHVNLNPEKRILIISGPNAGGKSITLKSIGLLQLMIQSGMLIPCNPDSVVGLFNKIMIDIGDAQSIENELSTYSSRLKRMDFFIKYLNKKSLFLIDELGSGTDPELGGAVAEAIVEEIAKSRPYGVITTHYPNIKLLAHKDPIYINGCMLFNQHELSPTYMLAIGQPGSSFTLEVAKQIGLPPNLIKNAANKIESGQLKLNKLLVELQNEKNKTIKKNEELSVAIEKHKKAEARYEELSLFTSNKLESTREKIHEMNTMAILGRKFQKVIEGFENTKEKKTETFKKVIGIIKAEKDKKQIEVNSDRVEAKRLKLIEKNMLWLKPGAIVKIKNTHQSGIVERLSKEYAYVQFGDIKSKVSIDLLQEVKEK
jgi:DNA mismatch repair protein MutS2